ncbi:hypothetical protein VKT23_002970 [Stygiomarasmius scandens]|uniref:Uncharacterized protein n=1 Tax=Marasmiellus scandens TaxID=2682957 RepID=A0ABR1JXJ7_9AGAR
MSKGWCLYLFTPLLVLGMVVDALLLQKRDTSQEPLIIPLLLDQNRYFINVTMSSGSGEQTFNLALSTGTGYTVVAGTDCPSCDNAERQDMPSSS